MFIVLLFSILCISFIPRSSTEILVNKVDRSIDLTAQSAKYLSKITLLNSGPTAVNDFILAVEKDQAPHLAYLEITDKKDDETKLQYAVTSVSGQSGKFFKVSLTSPLAKDQTATFNVEEVFTHVLEPFPAKIGQSDKQLVLYEANTVFYTPYEVKEQTTTVKLSSSTIESYSRLKPTKSNENTVTYGPYKNSKPYRTHELKIHFENNSPFLVVNEMQRWIEVSHWGNIAIEENYHMTHQGAQLKGHFSRYDYQRTPTHAAIKSFKTVLPSAAADVYYRDEIGNISTSNLLVQDDSVEVELRPRFPLFGGWQTKYMLGYNLPAYQYLYNKGDNYVLKMRLVDHVFDDFVVDKLTVKIVLPEGSTDVKVNSPYAVTEGKRALHQTYLDTTGRTVITLTKENVVESHIQDFEISYNFKKIQLLQEPLLCVAAFYILFLSVIFVVRLDFSITKDAAKESRMKVASLVEELLNACGRRTAVYAAVDSAIDKLKQSRNQAAFTTASKKTTQDYSTVTSAISELCAALVKEDSETSDKVADLQKKENERKTLEDQLVALATKVIANKISKQQYIESEQTTINRRDRIGDDIENVLASL